MSEYQYYEFAAIDRPLTDGEMAALRAVSTRAAITPSGFVNHYEWGGLKADPLDWMQRYFDAFVYLADWAHCRFALRLPSDIFGKVELKPFGVKQSLTIDAGEDHWILDWSLGDSENYDRFAEDDGRGWMGRLLPLRDELIRGDKRSLYLGWLAGVAKREVRETTLEPPVPAGLSQLSAAQNALAAFLEIDADMIAAAAIGSAESCDRPTESVDAWLQSLSPDELRSILKSIVRVAYRGRALAAMTDDSDPPDLRAENARLVALLESHGIEWRQGATVDVQPTPSSLNTEQKVALFRRLFRGRTDVYPVRWESKAGKTGYAPACANEWHAGICEKPRIKCSDCGHRSLIALTDRTIFDHLAGRHTTGVYPLLIDDTCNFLAVDFDDAEWREDAKAFAHSCRELGVPVALEVSRSGEGAHAWVFFSTSVSARDARRLGTALISFTCARTRQLKLTSYDRLFPSQDTMPKGGFGNLIALPLQKQPREQGRSVFVDDTLRAFPDQWAYLTSIEPMVPRDIEPTILRATGGSHPLDVTFVADEDSLEPWKSRSPATQRLAGPMPESVAVTLANLVYATKAELPQPLANRLVRLAAFQNPEFYRAQAMRMPVWDKPRVIGCAENFPQHIGLPRGCLDAVQQLFRDQGIRCDLRDERSTGEPLAVAFVGTLRPDQQAAAKAMLKNDIGVLCAPTAFGKTVTAAAMIASRGVNTLVLVNRTELLRQWKERLQSFLGVGPDVIGTIGGGKANSTGRIDVAVMQSLVGRGQRQGEVSALVENYGHVIVDECHHLSAFSFQAILKRAKAKYVLGLTATPVRRDGQQPIIFMQCGPIRHTAAKPEGAPQTLAVTPRFLSTAIVMQPDAGIQEVFRTLAVDDARTARIVGEIVDAYMQGRKVLVLTERTEHLAAIGAALSGRVQNLVTLQGRSSTKQRAAVLATLEALAPDTPRVLLSTGKLVGEGFDHPPLDTLILAMPISWKGTLQQYAGRLHREHADKTHVRIVDFVDTGHPALMRMWSKRQVGYRAMGYRVETSAGDLFPTENVQAEGDVGDEPPISLLAAAQ